MIFSTRLFPVFIGLITILFYKCSDEPDKEVQEPVVEVSENVNPELHKDVWYWQDEFSDQEKVKIKKWIKNVRRATRQLFGDYPFDVHFYIKRREGSSDPVPWAHTNRKAKVTGVTFNVDPSFTLPELNADWVAPHEISHLSTPFLGRENSWFSEGYASFMQYQIMAQMNTYDWSELNEKYKGRIEPVKGYYNSDQTFVEQASDLRASYRFPAMYWGSASFFIKADRKLKSDYGSSMIEVVRTYQSKRDKEHSLDEMIAVWDDIVGDTLFSDLLRTYRTAPAKTILTEF